MTRRESLKIFLAAGIWTALKGRLDAAQPSSMKDIENLQKNWKALLAEGTKLPSALRAAQTFERRMAQAVWTRRNSISCARKAPSPRAQAL